ncbi:MAG TPA: DUF1592 domain-containing protein [Bryobacteraceae bacterium]|nr:DUF1592 domain-containing protein [Bryobacteraceae bacterium]
MSYRTPILLLAGALGAYGAEFRTDVYPLLQKAGCPGCHNPDGVASGTRLRFPESSAPAAEVDEFGRSLQVLIDRAHPANSLLLAKPTRRVAHAGGKRIEPGSAEDAQLIAWITEAARSAPATNAPSSAAAHRAVGPVLRRLTHTQYNNTVRDLLGDDSRLANSFPPEDFVNGFRNQYEAQSISPLLAEAYGKAAEKLARRAQLTCDKPACRDSWLKDFGRRAFRRPLTAEETARYRRLFNSGGARVVLEGMLQSPNFLLRVEGGQIPEWKAYETASRLSYFLWNTMPDGELLRSAASGELNSAAGVERQVRRLTADPRAREAMNEFAGEWLRFDRLITAVKDRRTYPQFTPELTVAMMEEARRLFSDAAWNRRSFMSFYSADYAFLTADLAGLYGVKPPPADYGKVMLPPATERGGVLGQALFLALTSKPIETSPTARGLFVREQFLCQEVPQPPPGVSTNLPPISKAKPQTNRERLAAHLNNESCASCHQLIDPIGFGFEKFDAIGRRQEKQKLTLRAERGEKDEAPVTVELALDTTGEVAGIAGSAFSNPRELGNVLARSEQCQECVVKQLFRYAAGRHETAADRVVIRQAFEDFRKSGFMFDELLVALSKRMLFPQGATHGSRTD